MVFKEEEEICYDLLTLNSSFCQKLIFPIALVYKLGGTLEYGRNVLPLVEKASRSDLCTVSRCNKEILSVLLTPTTALIPDHHQLKCVISMFSVQNGKPENGHRYEKIWVMLLSSADYFY